MTHDRYENLKKLIIFLETILSQKINVEQLKKVEKFVIDFVIELESLFTKSIMLKKTLKLF